MTDETETTQGPAVEVEVRVRTTRNQDVDYLDSLTDVLNAVYQLVEENQNEPVVTFRVTIDTYESLA